MREVPAARILCYTSFTYAYLSRARTLFESVKKYHPDWHLVALVTDEAPAGLDVKLDEEPFDRLVTSKELDVGSHSSWIFMHDIVAACTAVKGPFLLSALEDGRYDSVIYLDPDTCLFNNLDPVVDLLKTSSIVLTPHQLNPSSSRMQIIDDEIGSLRHGIYNLGFLAVSRSDEGLRFARWWKDRLLSFCFDDAQLGLFVDQRWCDHVPVFFDGVSILKDPGYNIASWNIAQRHITFSEKGCLLVNGATLRFCHFTKVGSVGDVMLRRNAGRNFQAHEIWHWYGRQLERNKISSLPNRWWRYSSFDDGLEILPQHRKIWRERSDLRAAFDNPFSTGPGTFREWLTRNVADDVK